MDKKWLKKLVLVIGIVLLVCLFYWLYLEFHKEIALLFNPEASREMLLREVRSHGFLTAGILILLTALMCALPGLPTSVIGILVGVCYGPLIGSCINIVGNASGNLLSLTVLRHLKLVEHEQKASKWVKRISQMKHPKTGLMIAYMVPMIPSFVVNVTADSLMLSIKEVFLPVLIGALPASILYACGGEALFHGYTKTAVVLIASVIVLVLLVKLIKRDHHLVN
ncbi:TVP38/TMEM64 family protein [Enterococcus sp. AZ109]|uniref:TVP38/TMEM64 family protein n=1 Tax=Enterococcus sp. AZ109 TaxID=2774634 RepID=UPI003F225F56